MNDQVEQLAFGEGNKVVLFFLSQIVKLRFRDMVWGLKQDWNWRLWLSVYVMVLGRQGGLALYIKPEMKNPALKIK